MYSGSDTTCIRRGAVSRIQVCRQLKRKDFKNNLLEIEDVTRDLDFDAVKIHEATFQSTRVCRARPCRD